MTRYLKALGLAMMAAFAFSAIAAGSASAETTVGQLTSDGPVTLTGTETGPTGANALTYPKAGGGYEKVECAGSTYTGHKVLTHAETTEGKKHQLLPSGSTTATITPHYNQANCHSFPNPEETFDSTVTMNGCDYVVHTGHKVDEHTYEATFDVVCPPEKDIEVHTYLGASHGFQVCKTTVQPQTGLEGAHLTHTTEGDDIDIEGTITGIHASKSGLCGANTTNNATFDIDVTVKGHNAAGEPTEVTVTDETIAA